jgi:hypothetical protein
MNGFAAENGVFRCLQKRFTHAGDSRTYVHTALCARDALFCSQQGRQWALIFSPLQLPYPPNGLCNSTMIIFEFLSNGRRSPDALKKKKLRSFLASVTTKRAKIRRAQETFHKNVGKSISCAAISRYEPADDSGAEISENWMGLELCAHARQKPAHFPRKRRFD